MKHNPVIFIFIRDGAILVSRFNDTLKEYRFPYGKHWRMKLFFEYCYTHATYIAHNSHFHYSYFDF